METRDIGVWPRYQAELVESSLGVRVEMFGDVPHPHESTSVLGPRLLHQFNGHRRVTDGTVQERRHLLLDLLQRRPQVQPVSSRTTLSRPPNTFHKHNYTLLVIVNGMLTKHWQILHRKS